MVLSNPASEGFEIVRTSLLVGALKTSNAPRPTPCQRGPEVVRGQ